MSSSYYIMNK